MTTNKQDEPLIKLRFPGLPVRQLAGNDLAIDADKLEEYINSEVLSVLDELESKSTQEFPMSSGDNVPFVPLSAIQKLKEKYQ